VLQTALRERLLRLVRMLARRGCCLCANKVRVGGKGRVLSSCRYAAPQVPPFKKTLLDAMPYIDFLFGNETEARVFAASEGWDTQDVAEIALKVTAAPPPARLASLVVKASLSC
jgi:hypothetical protein